MSNERAEKDQPTQEEPRIEELPPKTADTQAADQVKGGAPVESVSLNFSKPKVEY